MKHLLTLTIIVSSIAITLAHTTNYPTSIFDGRKYYITPDNYESEICPYALQGDSIMFRTNREIHTLYDCRIYDYDIIVNKPIAEAIWNNRGNHEVLTDYDVMYVMALAMTRNGYDPSGPGDGYSAAVRKVAPHGYVRDWGWHTNSADGISPWFSYYNASKKTIKYITFYMTFENPVGDPCYDRITRAREVSVRGIGPVEEGTTGYWEWSEYEPVAYIRNADAANLKKILIEYMDGTKYTLIKEIRLGTPDDDD